MGPVSRVLALAAAVAVVACFELSGPTAGVASISALQSPSPGVAVKDVMRDSTAAPAPLRLTAFDSKGDTVHDAAVDFVVLDSGVSVDAAGVVHGGDSVTVRGMRIIARVGNLQTQPVAVRVVQRPAAKRDTVATARDTIEFNYPPIAALKDTTTSSFGFVVVDGTGKGVPSWPVRFAILSTTVLARDPQVAPVRTVDESGRVTRVDTTDDGGLGMRRLQIVPLAIDEASVNQRRTDTVVVRVTTVIGTTVQTRDYRFILRVRAGS